MIDDRYQLLPPLTDDEYAALRTEIAEHGVLVPVVYDQHGHLIDGHHRIKVCAELGIEDVPTTTVVVDDEDHARRLARVHNLARRHLTRQQRRELIAAEIGSDPDRSDRAIGRLLAVDHKTVGSVRRELRGELPHAETCGKIRPEPVGSLTETEDDVREVLTAAAHEVLTDEQRERASRMTETLRAVLVQTHDAIEEAWHDGLPAAFILETITDSLVTRCPAEVSDEARKILAPTLAELAVEAASERARDLRGEVTA